MKMRLTELRKVVRTVILESATEKLLGLPQNPGPHDVYEAVKNFISGKDPQRDIDFETRNMLDKAIENVMVKNQIRKDDEHIGSKLNMLRRILDPDKFRTDSYRAGIEAEMRELDPYGHRQKSGQLVRRGGQAEKTHWWDDEDIGWEAKKARGDKEYWKSHRR